MPPLWGNGRERHCWASQPAGAIMASGGKSWRDCDCNDCFLIRVTYALRVGVNQKDMKKKDMSRALLMITHGIMMEDVGARDISS
jgi:hypothetical protein